MSMIRPQAADLLEPTEFLDEVSFNQELLLMKLGGSPDTRQHRKANQTNSTLAMTDSNKK
jgi:hypothetical protein